MHPIPAVLILMFLRHRSGGSAVPEVEVYRRLNAVYHQLLSHDSLRDVLERVGDLVANLIPCQGLLIAEVDHEHAHLVPLLSRGAWSDEILRLRPRLGEGVIGWVAAHGKPAIVNDALSDPRAGHVAGTPEDEPEALLCAPLIARGRVIGALSVYREGANNTFRDSELEITTSFADAVTLALVNARRRDELEELTRRDDLTGLLNRRGLEHAFRTAQAVGAPDRAPTAVIVLDLDEFKAVNDRHGHHVGDRVLRFVADLLRTHARPGDAIARFGGDEFIVLLPQTPRPEAEHVAAAITEACRTAALIADGGRIDVRVSVGVAAASPQASSLEGLIVDADDNMYRHKTANRSRPEGAAHRDDAERRQPARSALAP